MFVLMVECDMFDARLAVLLVVFQHATRCECGVAK